MGQIEPGCLSLQFTVSKLSAAQSIFQKQPTSATLSINVKVIWINKLHYEKRCVHAQALVCPGLFHQHCCSSVYRVLLSFSGLGFYICFIFLLVAKSPSVLFTDGISYFGSG